MHMRIAMPHPLEKYPPHHLPSLYLLISQRPVGSSNFKEMVLLFWIPLFYRILDDGFAWDWRICDYFLWIAFWLRSCAFDVVNFLSHCGFIISCILDIKHLYFFFFCFPVFLGIKFGCELWLDAYPKTSLTALLDFILLDQPSVGFIGGTLILLSVFEP